MTCSMICGRRTITLLTLLAFSINAVTPASAKSPVKMKTFLGSIDFSEDGVSTFTLEGTASHLGRYTCYGEIEFVPDEEEGTFIGQGVAVFEAANGDLLVGEVTWEVDPADGDFASSRIHFAWRDFVEFSDGTVVENTGRFVDDRPPGLVVIAIIAILIGMLLPAVQKTR